MCLKTKQIMARVANKDITAYKVMYTPSAVDNTVISFFEHFKYTLGVQYNEPLMHKVPEHIKLKKTVFKAFHSYTDIRVINRYICNGIALYEVLIPKGSYYYISNDGKEIASNQIIIVKQL